MARFSLAGSWRRSVAGVPIDRIAVPGSYPPMGQCTLDFNFERPWPAADEQRVFLVTEGVLATAEFTTNGQHIGAAGPWARYRFELPRGLLGQRNVIAAQVRDTSEGFGPPPGRRFDAGLVRTIWLENRPAAFIDDVHFRTELNDDCTAAACTVAVTFDGLVRQAAEVVLTDAANGQVAARSRATIDAPAQFTVPSPRLWSPQSPALYRLTVTLPGSSDEPWSEQVGFRRFAVDGRGFRLNNQPLVLKGVCRHEFTSASGYSPSLDEVRRELAAIRHAGFNYVRLVHSPHGPEVCRIAAELGLLVSQEPGTCFYDLSDPAIYGPAYECLIRTVQRDRNVPSIFAWLIYNECDPNTDYAVRAAGEVRALDPGALLSFADCSGKHDQIKAMVAAADLSYYGINVYDPWPKAYLDRMAVFTDRPLVFTEWGGLLAIGNPRIASTLCETFTRHVQPHAEPRMAGCSFWVWADYEEKSRPGPAAIDGWTVEGLLDGRGRPRQELRILSRMCLEMDQPPIVRTAAIEVLAQRPQREGDWRPLSLADIPGDQQAMQRTIDERRAAQGGAAPRLGRLMVDGLEFHCGDGHPLLLGPSRPRITIPVDRTVSALAVLGHVAMAGGYPSSSVQTVWSRDAEPPRKLGDPASQYALEFEDCMETIALRHGLEVLRANDICRWWRTAPRGPFTRPVVRAVVHPSFEILRVDLWERQWEQPRRLKALHWTLLDGESAQAMYGLSVRLAEKRSR